jgi:hypothetical protein
MRKRDILILLLPILAGCAIRSGMVEGKFGESPVPMAGQMARLYLDSGDSLTARKIEQEKDTLYVTRMDYGSAAIPANRIDRILILDSDDNEGALGGSPKLGSTSGLGDNEKVGSTIARSLEIIGAIAAAIVIVTILL